MLKVKSVRTAPHNTGGGRVLINIPSHTPFSAQHLPKANQRGEIFTSPFFKRCEEDFNGLFFFVVLNQAPSGTCLVAQCLPASVFMIIADG